MFHAKLHIILHIYSFIVLCTTICMIRFFLSQKAYQISCGFRWALQLQAFFYFSQKQNAFNTTKKVIVLNIAAVKISYYAAQIIYCTSAYSQSQVLVSVSVGFG